MADPPDQARVPYCPVHGYVPKTYPAHPDRCGEFVDMDHDCHRPLEHVLMERVSGGG